MPQNNASTARPRVIAGSGRSGTTWVLDCLAEANRLRTIFEPLNPEAVTGTERFAHRYLGPDAECEELAGFLEAVFSGQRRPLWPTLRVRPNALTEWREPRAVIGNVLRLISRSNDYLSKRSWPTLTKFIRANLMLGWIQKRFDARIVLVLRHPGGVIASRKRLRGVGWRPEQRLQAYLADDALRSEQLADVAANLEAPLSRVAADTALWCVENLPAWKRVESGEICGVFYERLLAGDVAEWQRTLEALDLSTLPSEEVRAQPSQQADRGKRNQRFDEAQLQKWRRELTSEETQDMDRMLQLFGVQMYSAFDPQPSR